MNNLNSSNFCIMPFISINNKPNGAVSPCCHYKIQDDEYNRDDGNVNWAAPTDVFSSKYFERMRKDFLADIKHDRCATCWKQEEVGVHSLRMHKNDFYLNELGEARIEKLKTNPEILHYELALANKCNLACATCNPISSSLWEKEITHHDWFQMYYHQESFGRDNSYDYNTMGKNDILINDFKNNLSKTLLRLDISGGEPLINPTHDVILETLMPRADEIVLMYNTNGTVMRENLLWNTWTKFKEVQIVFSVDGIDDSFDFLRYPGKWSSWSKNVEKYYEFSKQAHNKLYDGEVDSGHNIDIFFLITISALNMVYVPKLLKFLERYDDGRNVNSNFVFDPFQFAAYNISDDAKRRIRDYIVNTYADDAILEHTVMREALGYMSRNRDDMYGENDNSNSEITRLVTMGMDMRRTLKFKEKCPEMYKCLFGDIPRVYI